jgi:hypothetical protein
MGSGRTRKTKDPALQRVLAELFIDLAHCSLPRLFSQDWWLSRHDSCTGSCSAPQTSGETTKRTTRRFFAIGLNDSPLATTRGPSLCPFSPLQHRTLFLLFYLSLPSPYSMPNISSFHLAAGSASISTTWTRSRLASRAQVSTPLPLSSAS